MRRQTPPDSIAITPTGPLRAELAAPSSKSLTIRALAAASLADGRCAIRRPLLCDDTWSMVRGLGGLGVQVTPRGSSLMVEGRAGRIPSAGALLDLGDAGTPLRLLTALCCLGQGRFVLDGSARMRQRPVAHLIDALQKLGVKARSINDDGCPPVEVLAEGLSGGRCRLRGEISSQFLSALLMAGPAAGSDLEIELEGDLVSRPYVELTLQVMAAFGVQVEREGYRWFRVPAPSSYRPCVYPVEGDASSASYLFAAAAVAGGIVRVTGIPGDSRQGDLGLLDLLERMGCRVSRDPLGVEVEGPAGRLRGIDADLGDMPDVAPTLAAVALFGEGPTTLRRIDHLRVKESDRVEGIAACVEALGGSAASGAGGLVITPAPAGRPRPAGIDPRGDHRLAMAFAVAGLAVPGIRIHQPGCVAKSFPGFFETLEALSG